VVDRLKGEEVEVEVEVQIVGSEEEEVEEVEIEVVVINTIPRMTIGIENITTIGEIEIEIGIGIGIGIGIEIEMERNFRWTEKGTEKGTIGAGIYHHHLSGDLIVIMIMAHLG